MPRRKSSPRILGLKHSKSGPIVLRPGSNQLTDLASVNSADSSVVLVRQMQYAFLEKLAGVELFMQPGNATGVEALVREKLSTELGVGTRDSGVFRDKVLAAGHAESGTLLQPGQAPGTSFTLLDSHSFGECGWSEVGYQKREEIRGHTALLLADTLRHWLQNSLDK